MKFWRRRPKGDLHAVPSWPTDPDARQALARYLNNLPADPAAPRTTEMLFNGWGLDLGGSDLSGLDLGGAELGEARLTGARLVDTDLYGAWMLSTDLSGADLTGADLGKAQARDCTLRETTLHGARLMKADFATSDFHGADLTGADLRRGTFSDTDFRGASLRECRVDSASFCGARLGHCAVAGAAGTIDGPVDVGERSPHWLDGAELAAWFAASGAPAVTVRSLH